MRFTTALIALMFSSAAYADDCMRHDPIGYDGCTGTVAKIELYDERDSALAWLLLNNVKCTGKSMNLFVLGNQNDTLSFSSKVSMAEYIQKIKDGTITVIYNSKNDPGEYKHVVRIDIPSRKVCDDKSIEFEGDLGNPNQPSRALTAP